MKTNTTKTSPTPAVVPNSTPAAASGFTLGLDLGDRAHHVCVLDTAGNIVREPGTIFSKSTCPSAPPPLGRRYRETSLQLASSALDELVPQFLVQHRLFQELGVVGKGLGRLGFERQPDGEEVAAAVRADGLDAAAVVMDDEKAGHQVDAVF